MYSLYRQGRFLNHKHYCCFKMIIYMVFCAFFLAGLCSCNSTEAQQQDSTPILPTTTVILFAGTPITAGQIDDIKITKVQELIQKNDYINNQAQNQRITDYVFDTLFDKIEINKQMLEYHVSSLDELINMIAPLKSFNTKEAHQFYQTHTYLFSPFPPKIHVREIAVGNKNLALHLLDQLHKGASFSQLAQQYSVDPDQYRLNGGDLGWITQGQMPSEWDAAAFALSTNQISNVFQVSHLYFIIQLIGGPSYDPVPYQQVAPPVPQVESQFMQQEQFLTWLSGKITQEHITILNKNYTVFVQNTLSDLQKYPDQNFSKPL
jgi:parvulin-like peptidyl-prolyl isomerase